MFCSINETLVTLMPTVGTTCLRVRRRCQSFGELSMFFFNNLCEGFFWTCDLFVSGEDF